MKNSLRLLGILLFFGAGLFFTAQIQAADDIGASDAIAIRVMPNSNFYSITRWYESQGFKGSPQALTVDGYEAIRDGRTVYVNAAHISYPKIYTNIYIISYNQEPDVRTVDILGQIIDKWKFNVWPGDQVSTCSVSALSCQNNQDCGVDQTCDLASTSTNKYSCKFNVAPSCRADKDCPSGFFCNTFKARIMRDVKRIGQMTELKEALFRYKTANGRYPVLDSGSYIPNATVSTWPSWSQVFLANLGVASSLVDPVNRLNITTCMNPFTGDQKTGWNDDSKFFCSNSWYDAGISYFNLPYESYAWSYKTDPQGSYYNLCFPMEIKFFYSNYYFANFSTSTNVFSGQICASGGSSFYTGGSASNTPPYIVATSLNGETGQEFNGFISVADDENNPLTWTLAPLGMSEFATWRSGGVLNAPPLLQDTNSPYQKKLFAEEAGVPGLYDKYRIIITDGQGGSLNTLGALPINITNPAPFIEAEDGEYLLSINTPFSYRFFFSDNNLNSPLPANTVTETKIFGPPSINLLSSPGITRTVTPAGLNKYQVKYEGIISTSSNFTVDTDFVYQFKVTDKYNASSTKQVTIRLLVDNPNLNFDCQTNIRNGKPYSCYIGQTVLNNHDLLDYEIVGTNPPGLGLNLVFLDNTQQSQQNQNQNNQSSRLEPSESQAPYLVRLFKAFKNIFYKLDAVSAASDHWGDDLMPINKHVYLRGTSTTPGLYNLKIKATNSYGSASTKDLSFKVNTYCGDGERQTPNTENSGGYYNDGYEDCDGLEGVATSPDQSSSGKQYGCRTNSGSPTPYPIPNNTYCIFKSPLEGGGYCGDTFCQAVIVLPGGLEFNMEDGDTCPDDCNPSSSSDHGCTPSCFNKTCGSDGCGGSCGTCSSGQACYQNQCGSCGVENSGCQANLGENCQTCPLDCSCTSGYCLGNPPFCYNPNHCGNNSCQSGSPYNETCSNCPQDCGCNSGQQCINGACVTPNHCGDGTCNHSAPDNETCGNCEADCGCVPWKECCESGYCHAQCPI